MPQKYGDTWRNICVAVPESEKKLIAVIPLTDSGLVFFLCIDQWAIKNGYLHWNSGSPSQVLGNTCSLDFSITYFSRHYTWICPQAVLTWHLYLFKIQLHVMLRFAKMLRALEHPGLCVCITKEEISPGAGNYFKLLLEKLSKFKSLSHRWKT